MILYITAREISITHITLFLSACTTSSFFLMIYLVFQMLILDKYTTNFRFIVERVSSNILNKIFKRTVYLEAIAYFLL